MTTKQFEDLTTMIKKLDVQELCTAQGLIASELGSRNGHSTRKPIRFLLTCPWPGCGTRITWRKTEDGNKVALENSPGEYIMNDEGLAAFVGDGGDLAHHFNRCEHNRYDELKELMQQGRTYAEAFTELTGGAVTDS